MFWRVFIVYVLFGEVSFGQTILSPKERLKTLLSNQNAWKSVVYMEDLSVEGDNSMTWRNESMPYVIEIAFESDGASDLGVKVLLKSNTNQEAIVGYNFGNERLYLNTINAGKTNVPDALGLFTTPLKVLRGRVKFYVFVQKNLVEVFANDGEGFLSSQVFPEDDSFDWQIFTVSKAKVAQLGVYEMKKLTCQRHLSKFLSKSTQKILSILKSLNPVISLHILRRFKTFNCTKWKIFQDETY
ncbi:MAG: GH32 C-terminal domain-containing protein [Emticicia sp.]|nr:GH32 C-terminal domain-containing protein [Emticicia sp.]